MPDLFTDEYETARKRWEKAKKDYDGVMKVFETMHNLLEAQFKELEEATKLFLNEQTKLIKKGKNPVNIKSIREK